MEMIGLKRMSGLNGFFNDFNFITQNGTLKKVLRNVIGVLPGKSKKEELIIFSAHYDHIGTIAIDRKQNQVAYIFKPITADTIYNGANDDASGIAALLALAEYFTIRNLQERTILFIAFSAEEIGMVGSQKLLAELEPSLVKANINLEMLGRKGESGKKPFITGGELSDMQSLLNNCLKKTTGEKQYFKYDPVPEQGLFRRSDNISFARAGIPAHTIMLSTSKDKFYHHVADEPNTLDYNLMATIIKNIALASECLVTGDATPTRIDKRKINAKK